MHMVTQCGRCHAIGDCCLGNCATVRVFTQIWPEQLPEAAQSLPLDKAPYC
jgi:hypothetical protein